MRWTSAVLIAILAGCSNPVGLDTSDVAGTWVWAGSQGSIAGVSLTPASEGYSVRVELDGAGSASAFRNDSLVATVTYAVMPRLSLVPEGHPSEYEIVFDPPLAALPFAAIEGGVLRFDRDDTLRIEEACCDRYTHAFARDD